MFGLGFRLWFGVGLGSWFKFRDSARVLARDLGAGHRGGCGLSDGPGNKAGLGAVTHCGEGCCREREVRLSLGLH